jgi:4-amino-4-deoxy-L-arabinose transferase-like glycosyltransferase
MVNNNFFIALIVRIVFGIYFNPNWKPWSVDEAIYIKSGELYINHFLQGHTDLDDCLQHNYTHPMFAKLLFGLSTFLFGPFIGNLVAARLVGILFGALTCAVVFSLAEKMVNLRFGLFAGLALSFHGFLIVNNVHVMLDTVCIFFMLFSILLLYLYLESSRMVFFIFSAISLGLAVSSKYFGILTVPIVLIWILPKIRRNKKWVLMMMVWMVVGSLVFVAVQPRLWYDPIVRISESWVSNFGHNVRGHPIPVSSVLGDGSWSGERMAPPYWIMIYWLIASGSVFDFVGIIVLIAVIPIMLKSARANSLDENRLFLCLFLIPLLYFTLQPVRLSQYLTIIIPGFVLTICIAYYHILRVFQTNKSNKYSVVMFAGAQMLILVLFILHIIYGLIWKETFLKPFFYDFNSFLVTISFSLVMISMLFLISRSKYKRALSSEAEIPHQIKEIS